MSEGAQLSQAEDPSSPVSDGEQVESRPAVRIKLFARTDVGQVREHNEDNFLVADLTRGIAGLQEDARDITLGIAGELFAVCDGMGGAAAGEVASQMAVDTIYKQMSEGASAARPTKRNEIARRLVRSVEMAGQAIFQEAKADRARRGMGTTATAATLVDDHLFLAQVGDSRAYLLRSGTLVQVTRDQSLVNQLIEAGQLTEEEAETFEHNNIILQALGTADTVQVDLTYVHLMRGDVLMLCSDGLSGMVRNDEIREVLKALGDPMDACKALTERANLAGGHDNITVIVARFDGDGLRALNPDEPLVYRKYPLPQDEPTEPGRRVLSSPSAAMRNSGKRDNDEGDSSSASAERARRDADESEEDRVEIPGTHVPTGVVVALIVGVIALLGATAFLLLR